VKLLRTRFPNKKEEIHRIRGKCGTLIKGNSQACWCPFFVGHFESRDFESAVEQPQLRQLMLFEHHELLSLPIRADPNVEYRGRTGNSISN
jgi:hypothetical protein